MTSARQTLLVGSAAVVALLAAAAWSWSYLDERKSASFSEIEDRRACKTLADQIEQLRGGTSSAASRPARQLDLTGEIASCAAQAGLSPRSLDRIEHDPPRHSEGSSNLERPTRILVRSATLRQIIMMLHGLDRPADGLRVERIHLTTPTDATDSQTWSAEATLVQTASDGHTQQ